ncbi:hypothetical protein LTR70_010806, partial [Exophiala xenobiotica]
PLHRRTRSERDSPIDGLQQAMLGRVTWMSSLEAIYRPWNAVSPWYTPPPGFCLLFSPVATASGMSLCSCFDCGAQLRAQWDGVFDARQRSAQQQASLAVKRERLQTVSNEVVGDHVGMAAPRSHHMLIPLSTVMAPQAYNDPGPPLCSCPECQIQIHVRLENVCRAQRVSAQKRASLASQLAQLQRLSQETLHHIVRAGHRDPPDVAVSSMGVSQDRPQGTKRKRREHYSAGSWPSEMTSTTGVHHEQFSLT